MEIEFERKTTVGDLLQGFRRKHGSLAKLRAKVQRTRKVTRASMELEEWEHYAHSTNPKYKPDDVVPAKETILFHSPERFFAAVTPARLRLFETLRNGGDYQSVRELAIAVSRDPKNVQADLGVLQDLRLVRMERRNRRRSIPRARVDRIRIVI